MKNKSTMKEQVNNKRTKWRSTMKEQSGVATMQWRCHDVDVDALALPRCRCRFIVQHCYVDLLFSIVILFKSKSYSSLALLAPFDINISIAMAAIRPASQWRPLVLFSFHRHHLPSCGTTYPQVEFYHHLVFRLATNRSGLLWGLTTPIWTTK